MFEWQDRFDITRKCFVPWIESAHPLRDAFVVEFGCGTGSVGLALASHARRVLGVDIDAGSVGVAEHKRAERSVRNAAFSAHTFEGCLAAVREASRTDRGESGRAGCGVDVFMLYAVLEHMTLDERLRILGFADSVLAPDGVIVICESPNRLLWGDYHTSQTPFNLQLPEDVSLRYTSRLKRRAYIEAIEASRALGPEAEHEAFVRWGRGISYHEFELAGVFDRIIGSNWDPELLPCRHVEREELMLARHLSRHAAELPTPMPACFSRCYIDCIIGAPGGRRVRERKPEWRPWSMHTNYSNSVGYTEWDTLVFQRDDSLLSIRLPVPARRLLLGIEPLAGANDLALRADHGELAAVRIADGADRVTRHETVVFERPASEIQVRARSGVGISFVAYQAMDRSA
ncbi:MAG: class I SAM-dependent methyltransferase [Phycisphaerae bacterium]|nr:class I SAM-dependent methyltransferase [Phycisphaerae bacterium]